MKDEARLRLLLGVLLLLPVACGCPENKITRYTPGGFAIESFDGGVIAVWAEYDNKAHERHSKLTVFSPTVADPAVTRDLAFEANGIVSGVDSQLVYSGANAFQSVEGFEPAPGLIDVADIRAQRLENSQPAGEPFLVAEATYLATIRFDGAQYRATWANLEGDKLHAYTRTIDEDGVLGTVVDLGVEVAVPAVAGSSEYTYFTLGSHSPSPGRSIVVLEESHSRLQPPQYVPVYHNVHVVGVTDEVADTAAYVLPLEGTRLAPPQYLRSSLEMARCTV